MAYYKFADDDIINISVATHPSYTVQLNGDQVTGSIYLEKKYLNNDLAAKHTFGDSEKEGGKIEKLGPFTSSIDLLTATRNAGNKQIYESISQLYDQYTIINNDYQPRYNGTLATTFRIITVPSIYYDKCILSGTLTASDKDAAGANRFLYDNGRGGVYSGSLTGTLVGNIFYDEGLIVLTKTDLSNFGSVSSTNFKWSVSFKGVHNIPTKILKCRAPAAELNASSNPTYYYIPSSSLDNYRDEKNIILSEPTTYITTIGIYDENYNLVAIAKTAQPIKKTEGQSILFRLKIDF